MKNLLKLHEAIVLALLDKENRRSTFNEIALYIELRNLYPERKGNISLTKQVMLRATNSKGHYSHLFEMFDAEPIALKDI